MISKINITIVLLAILFGFGFANWQSLNGPPAGRADDMSIGWDSEDNCWVIFAADRTHKLYKSTDLVNPLGEYWDSIVTHDYVVKPTCVITEKDNAQVVYVGEVPESPNTHCVWKSTNGGQSWNFKDQGITNTQPLCFCMDPNNSSIVYLGCEQDDSQYEMFKTTNGGNDWSALSNFPNTQVNDIAITHDPLRGTWIIVGCEYGSYKGIWLSTNGGTNWSQKLSGQDVYSLSFASQSIGYAGTGNDLYKTEDGGGYWSPIGNFSSVTAVAAVTATEIYIAASGSSGFGIYRTTDGGSSWPFYYGRNDRLFCNDKVIEILIHPNYATNHQVFTAGDWAVYRLDDPGADWQELNKGFAVDTIPRFGVKDNRIYTAGFHRRYSENHRLAIWRSNDGSQNWVCTAGYMTTSDDRPINNELHWIVRPVPSLVAISPRNKDIFLFSGQAHEPTEGDYAHHIFKSTNAGKDWELSHGEQGCGRKNYAISISSLEPDIIFAGYATDPAPSGPMIILSTDEGGTWTDKINGLGTSGDIYTIAINSQETDIVYAGSQCKGVFRTSDLGDSWEETSLNSGEVKTLGIDPDIASTVYAGMTSGLKKTTNSGNNWSDANQGLGINHRYITDIEVDPEEPTILYLIGQTDNTSTSNHCYLSVDRAAKWIEITDGLPDYTYALEFDPDHPDKTYSSTQAGLYTYTPDFNKSLVSSSEDATAFNGGRHLVRVGNTLWCCYSSGNVVYGTKSTDLGSSWSKKMELSGGVLPAIDHMEIGMPGGPEVGVAWVSRGASCDTVYFREYANSTWQNSYVVYTTDGTVGPPSVTYTNDQIFVIFDETPAEPNGEYVVCAHFRPGYEPTVDTLDCGPVIGYCSIDYSNNYVHAVWEQNGEIYYNYYYDNNWGAEPYRVSNGDGDACQPMIEAYNNYIYVTYSDLDGSERNIYWRYHFFDPDYRWSGIIPVTSTSNSSEYSSLSNGLQCTYTEAGEIWYCHYDGLTWTGHRNISQTLGQQSIYSHINFYQTPFFTKTFFIWTEGNSPPYDVEFRNHTLEGSVPTGFINPGEIEPAPENIYRDGYRSYGEKSYEYHDYGDDYIAYRVTNLNPEYIYEFEFLGYYNEGNTKLRVSVDESFHLQVNLNQGELIRKKFAAPAKLYSDSTILFKIERMSGPEASLALLLIYEYEPEGGLGGPQSHANVSADKLLFDISPTITSRSFNIRLQGMAGKKVTLKIYDATGRLVKDFSPLLSDIGYRSSVIWDAKDGYNRKLSSGVYFVRLETEDHKITKKAILLR
jgi:photosystem II stability/assembly factor-like uncharacterized protein